MILPRCFYSDITSGCTVKLGKPFRVRICGKLRACTAFFFWFFFLFFFIFLFFFFFTVILAGATKALEPSDGCRDKVN